MTRTLRSIVFIAFIFLLIACGTSITDKDFRGEGTQRLEAPDILGFPASTEEGIVDGKNVPGGLYQLTSFVIYVRDRKSKTAARFSRALNKAGTVEEADLLNVKSDFQNLAQITSESSITAELSLPNSFGSSGTSVDFRDKHYYASSVTPDGRWRWRSSAKESPGGLRFFDILTLGAKTSPVLYEKADVVLNNQRVAGKLTTRVRGPVVTFYVAATTGEFVDMTAHINYQKQN